MARTIRDLHARMMADLDNTVREMAALLHVDTTRYGYDIPAGAFVLRP